MSASMWQRQDIKALAVGVLFSVAITLLIDLYAIDWKHSPTYQMKVLSGTTGVSVNQPFGPVCQLGVSTFVIK